MFDSRTKRANPIDFLNIKMSPLHNHLDKTQVGLPTSFPTRFLLALPQRNNEKQALLDLRELVVQAEDLGLQTVERNTVGKYTLFLRNTIGSIVKSALSR